MRFFEKINESNKFLVRQTKKRQDTKALISRMRQGQSLQIMKTSKDNKEILQTTIHT